MLFYQNSSLIWYNGIVITCDLKHHYKTKVLDAFLFIFIIFFNDLIVESHDNHKQKKTCKDLVEWVICVILKLSRWFLSVNTPAGLYTGSEGKATRVPSLYTLADINTWRVGTKWTTFAEDIFKCIFLTEITMEFVS